MSRKYPSAPRGILRLHDGSVQVMGLPVVQGNHRVSRLGRIYEANSAELHAWRSQIAWAVRAGKMTQHTKPCAVMLDFRLPRPRRPRFDRPGVRPDIDKLTRPVLDALTLAGILADDSLVVTVVASKHYADDDHPVGVTITVLDVGEAA